MSEIIIIKSEADRQRAIDFIRDLPIDKPHKMEVKLHRKKRTLNQNSLYWKWMTILGDETGHSAEEMHIICLQKFAPVKLIEAFGTVSAMRSSSAMNTAEMSDYMTQIMAMGVEFDIQLPTPQDLGYEQTW